MSAVTESLIILFISYCMHNKAANATFYREVSLPGSIENDIDTTPALIDKCYYQCSIKDTCNYVVKDVRSSTYTTHDKEEDLPSTNDWHRIWRKLPSVEEAKVASINIEAYLANVSNTCKIQKMPNTTFTNCQDAYDKGHLKTNLYPIQVPNIGIVNIRCDMSTDGGGWMVIQRRVDATVDFYRTFNEYKHCFGDLNGNFWIGLDIIHQLAAPSKSTTLRVDLRHMDAGSKYAKYNVFKISNESNGYKLEVSGYSGTAPDSLLYNNGFKFSAKDTSKCGIERKGAWWYYACTWANLNGLYPTAGAKYADRMSWYYMTNSWGRVTFSEMKIKYPTT